VFIHRQSLEMSEPMLSRGDIVTLLNELASEGVKGFMGDHVRLELRARDVPDLDMWAAEGNGDLFELEFGRRVEPVAVEVA
jgi:hypothetical protein